MLKKNWKTLLISATVFLITFFHCNIFIEGVVWTKWALLLLASPLIGITLFLGKKKRIQVDSFFLLVSSFSLLLLFKAIMEHAFFHYTWYIIAFWLLYSFFYFNKISRILLYHVFVFTGAILSIIGYIQYFTGDKFIVGVYDNPAGFAFSLTLFLPFIFYLWKHCKNHKTVFYYAATTAMLIVAVLLSASRTAIIAVFYIIISTCFVKYKKYTYSVLCILFLCLLFFMKNDSTIGRFFILSNSFDMLENNFLWGYGFGGFRSQYMTFQAQTFKSSFNEKYIMLADDISHPLNEFMLFLIEHGWIFSIIGLGILLVYLIKAKKNSTHYLCLVSILIFSLFSYPFRYPLTLLIFAYSLSNLKMKAITITFPRNAHIIIFALCGIWLYYIIGDITNNRIWAKQYNKVKLGQFSKAKTRYKDLSITMANNVNFLFNYASVLYRAGQYDESLFYAKKCLKWRNNYDVQLLLADNYYRLNNNEAAINHYKTASFMCPNRFSPLYGLFEIYNSTKDIDLIIECGHQILSKPIKVNSIIIQEIIQDVKIRIDSIDNFNYHKTQ